MTTPSPNAAAPDLVRVAREAESDYTPGYGPHKADMEALAEGQRRGIAERIRARAALRPAKGGREL